MPTATTFFWPDCPVKRVKPPSDLLDDLFSHRLHEVTLSGIHGAGEHEVLPNLRTHEALSLHLLNYVFTHEPQWFKRQKKRVFKRVFWISNLVPDQYWGGDGDLLQLP